MPKKLKLSMLQPTLLFLLFIFALSSCTPKNQKEVMTSSEMQPEKGTFGYDLNFMKKYQNNLVVLSSADSSAQLIISPDYQARVLTSTAAGLQGKSFGWINYDLIARQEFTEHMNAFGGEDRFWMGPEGGQYSIFFKPDTEFTLANWQTPASIDTEPFEEVSQSETTAVFSKKLSLTNYAGKNFQVQVNRTITLLDQHQIAEALGIAPSNEVQKVAFSSTNEITNAGDEAWEKETGLLSVWILGMFQPSLATTIIIPVEKDIPDASLPMLNDAYFGKVPEDRLVIQDSVIFFKGDGKYRSKIGVLPQRAKQLLGSYDAQNQVLTIVKYTLSPGNTDYVNSMWELQEKPYGGDAVNAYNDGPLEDGSQMGPFYELESSSPAVALTPGQSLTHVHTTFHFSGSESALNVIAKQVLGVDIATIELIWQ
jgi:hypothetical protein